MSEPLEHVRYPGVMCFEDVAVLTLYDGPLPVARYGFHCMNAEELGTATMLRVMQRGATFGDVPILRRHTARLSSVEGEHYLGYDRHSLGYIPITKTEFLKRSCSLNTSF